jgi:deazaflavin-dependent oxidoreductase (nitroreductase family)
MATARSYVNHYVSALHVWIYRATKGAVGARMGAANILLLTTTGRKSGAARTTPVNAFHDGDRIALIASNGGQDHHPAWYLNIVANPAVTVERKGVSETKSARVATDEEKAALWPRIVAWYPGYAKYQTRTSRDIPVVIVE